MYSIQLPLMPLLSYIQLCVLLFSVFSADDSGGRSTERSTEKSTEGATEMPTNKPTTSPTEDGIDGYSVGAMVGGVFGGLIMGAAIGMFILSFIMLRCSPTKKGSKMLSAFVHFLYLLLFPVAYTYIWLLSGGREDGCWVKMSVRNFLCGLGVGGLLWQP